GTIAERLGRRGIKTSTISVASMIIFTAVQVAIALQGTGAALPLWILFGFFGTTGILMYPVLSRTFPAALAGRVNTGINLLVFLNAFAVQWAVGAIVDLWPASTAGAFAPQGYAAAFAVQAMLQVAGLFWYWLFRSRRLDPIR
ncbi:MAG: MFS transporter, partial [Proteobacteria bacterium]|nr:MFS transporter [Pseudomonadota bacterium]